MVDVGLPYQKKRRTIRLNMPRGPMGLLGAI